MDDELRITIPPFTVKIPREIAEQYAEDMMDGRVTAATLAVSIIMAHYRQRRLKALSDYLWGHKGKDSEIETYGQEPDKT